MVELVAVGTEAKELLGNVTGAVPAFRAHPCLAEDSPELVGKFWDALGALAVRHSFVF